jgi:hypothetical protein
MDNFRFYLGDVKTLSFENLIPLEKRFRNYDESFRLYRKNEIGENDWHLIVSVKETYGGWKILVTGSVRKWYFGKFTFRDLTRIDFENCVDLISDRLGLEKDVLWGAKTYVGEISLTMKMKPEMRFFLKNLVSYKTFDVMRVGDDTLKFFGDAKSLKFYNSGAKIWKERNFGKGKIEKLQSLYFVIFRVEATIKDLSHVENGMEELLGTPGKILKNWNEIYAKLRMYVNDVNCYGVSSVQRFDLRNGGKKEFQRHLFLSGIEFLSPETCFADARLLKSAKVRYEVKKWLQELLSKNGCASSSKDELLLYFDRKLAKICA